MALPNGFQIRAEILQHLGVRACGPAVDRGVTGDIALLPVADNQELSRLLEEGIHVADDNDVDIEEEDFTLQFWTAWSAEVGRKGDELSPAALRGARWQLEARDRESLDAWIQAILVISQADEAMRDREMPLHHRMETIDVFGTILGAPLHAKDGSHARSPSWARNR